MNKETVNITVHKRDNSDVPFDSEKIYNAIAGAFRDVYNSIEDDVKNVVEEVVSTVVKEIKERHKGSVKIYEIQAIVEHTLLKEGLTDVAKAYSEYRLAKDLHRAEDNPLVENISKLLNKDKTVVNENANKDSRVYNTIRDLTAGSVAKAVGLAMLPPRVAEAHKEGDIHWHDLDMSPKDPMTNCCIIDFKEMYKGYKMGNAEIEPPKSIETAVAQMTQIIMNIAVSQYGGITVNRIDEILEPYAKLSFEKHVRNILEESNELNDVEMSEEEFDATVKEIMAEASA